MSRPAKRTRRGRRPIDWAKVEGTLAYWQTKWEQHLRFTTSNSGPGTRMVERFVQWMGPRRRLDTIGPTEIAAYTRRLAREGRPPRSIHRRLMALRVFFAWLLKMQAVAFNPVAVPKPPSCSERPRPKPPSSWAEAIRKLQGRRALTAQRVRTLTSRIDDFKRRKAAGEPFPAGSDVSHIDGLIGRRGDGRQSVP